MLVYQRVIPLLLNLITSLRGGKIQGRWSYPLLIWLPPLHPELPATQVMKCADFPDVWSSCFWWIKTSSDQLTLVICCIHRIILPSYRGSYIIIISHYKDPYKPISIMECQQGFERCSKWGLARATYYSLQLLVENISPLNQHLKDRQKFDIHSLVGGFKYFYFPPYLGKWYNLTNIFQMGWNHQLDSPSLTNASPKTDGFHGFQVPIPLDA